jgi:hypothetical protein
VFQPVFPDFLSLASGSLAVTARLLTIAGSPSLVAWTSLIVRGPLPSCPGAVRRCTPTVRGCPLRELFARGIDVWHVLRLKLASTLGASTVTLCGPPIAGVSNDVSTGGCAGTRWASRTALAGAAIAGFLRGVMHARVAARREIAIAGRLVHLGRGSVAVGHGLVAIGGGLVAIRARLVCVCGGLIAFRERLIISQRHEVGCAALPPSRALGARRVLGEIAVPWGHPRVSRLSTHSRLLTPSAHAAVSVRNPPYGQPAACWRGRRPQAA